MSAPQLWEPGPSSSPLVPRVDQHPYGPQWLLELTITSMFQIQHKRHPWKSHRALLLMFPDLELRHMTASRCKGGWVMEAAGTSILENRWGCSLACLKRQTWLEVVDSQPSTGLYLHLPLYPTQLGLPEYRTLLPRRLHL